MKKSFSTLLSLAAVAVAGLASGSSAFAQGTFTPGTGATANCNPGNGGSYTSVACSVGTVSATMEAWGYNGAANTTGSSWTKGSIGDFNDSGFGAYTGGHETSFNSQHAFDNLSTGVKCGTSSAQQSTGCGGSIEGLFLNFGASKVNITTVGIGYNNPDADFMVWAWTGNSSGPAMASQAVGAGGNANCASQQNAANCAGTLTGWTLVGGTDSDIGGNPYTVGGSTYSSYFLITTYFGASYSFFEMGDDAFKINSFTAATCSGTLNGNTCSPTVPNGQVPEPASLALVSLALLGGAAVRRRTLRG